MLSRAELTRAEDVDASELEPLVGTRPDAMASGTWSAIVEAVAFQRDDLARVIGENAQPREAQVDQNLRADAAFVLQQPLPRRIAVDLPARVIQHARQLARSAAARLLDARSRVRCGAGRPTRRDPRATIASSDARHHFVAVAGRGGEHVAGQAVRMHAHQRRRRRSRSPRTSAMCCSRSTSLE